MKFVEMFRMFRFLSCQRGFIVITVLKPVIKDHRRAARI